MQETELGGVRLHGVNHELNVFAEVHAKICRAARNIVAIDIPKVLARPRLVGRAFAPALKRGP